MNPAAVALVVAAAVAHAGWNLCAKRVPSGGAVFVWLYGTVAAAVCVPLAVITVLVQDQTPTRTWMLVIGLSGLLHVTYFVLLQRGTRSATCPWCTRWLGAPARCSPCSRPCCCSGSGRGCSR